MAGYLERLGLVAGLDEDEAGEDLLGLGERAVGDQALAATPAHGAGGGDGLEGGGGDEVAPADKLGVVGQGLAIQGLLFLRTEGSERPRLEIDEAEKLHRA